MEEKNRNENQTPPGRLNIAFPRAKFGVYLALIIIVLVLIILYKDFIF